MDESRDGHADTYCGTPDAPHAPTEAGARSGPPFADCVLCGEPTEYPEATRGATLCPVCEWREAERTACSG
ncbi:hypothetical protein [Streptomyces kanasensis]|uniref:hypothetical protein n=1 Tax=Streptomyces kanasensis TaxID=936756 RepID=UPI0036FBB4DD